MKGIPGFLTALRTFATCSVLSVLSVASAQAADANLTSADRSFLSDAAASNQKEIDVSNLAIKQASASQVKSFANTMVRDHTRLGAMMKAKFGDAASAGTPASFDELSGKSGKAFDKAYMDMMVSDHGMVKDKFEQAATGADHSASVHHAAANALPTIRHHAQMARSIDAKLSSH